MDHSTTTTPLLDPAGGPETEAGRRLHALLDAELDFDPVARGGFINHLAMSLVAVERLGGDSDTLDRWYDAQVEDDFLVRRERPGRLETDARRIRRDGISEEVRRRMPALVDSPGSQFFHAIIRLEHAVDARHAGQVANALLNWEQHDHGLPAAPDGSGSRSFRQVARDLDGLMAERREAVPGPRQLAELPWFAESIGELRGDDALLDEVADVALETHLTMGTIGSLHLVTGTRAARSLVGLLDAPDARRLALSTAHSVAAGRVGFGAPPLGGPAASDRARPEHLPGWPAIVDAALASLDPHVAKLVHSCEWELERTGDQRYVEAAAKETNLL